MMERATEPIECASISRITSDAPDDALICCGSPEDRCLGTINRLTPDYHARTVYLIRYTNHESRKRAENIEKMRQKLSTVGPIRDIQIDEEKPIPVIMDLIEEITKSAINTRKARISIDISTIRKWHLLIFMKAFEAVKERHLLRFLYTEPEDYVTDLFQPLSFGIKDIFPIPNYSGNFDFSRDSLLVLMLGYEGDRALALFEEMDPTECLLLIAKPSYHEEWEGRAEVMNKGIISAVGSSQIRYIHSRNPILVAYQLRELLSHTHFKQYNHVISPLGTKPQTLGLHCYLSSNPPNTVLLYGSPARHNELFYSKGIGRSWVLPY